ncbi:hypothetical protein DEO72_LG5g855 [Vigna unguiculata]|uniref:Uncharacterized protein n=1 Tax=Vigna unguiculata TaxID=3917 RepID=A0A4D6LXS4_VIGUN|nr:hypothetical protein DEO72_LG5g855 [Vigna unguiculata]
MVLQGRLHATSNQHSYYKEDNPRKRTKYTNSGSQSSKISDVQNNMNDLQNLNAIFQTTYVPENNISSSCSIVFHNQSKNNLINSQSPASTVTYNSSFCDTSEVVNDSYFVSKNKVVQYPFEVIQSLQNRFYLDDETATEQNCSDTNNDSSSTITPEGKVNAQLSLIQII